MTPRHLAHRVGGAAIVVVLASVLVALMVDLVPGDAASAVAGSQASVEELEEVRQELGLDDPIWTRYWHWASDAARGDFGESLVSGRNVSDMIIDALPATLSVTLVAVVIAVAFGIALGGIAGVRGGVVDRIASLIAGLGVSMPSFWVGMLLVTVFSLELNWFPATGYRPFTEDPWTWLRHVTLPAVALGLAMSAEIARQTRSGVVDVMERPHIRTARAKGVSETRLVTRHVARNAAIPVVTVLGLQIGSLLGGVIVVEQVFGIAGLGSLAIGAVMGRDFPVVQAYVVLVTVVVVTINLAVDMSYGFIDPKVRER